MKIPHSTAILTPENFSFTPFTKTSLSHPTSREFVLMQPLRFLQREFPSSLLPLSSPKTLKKGVLVSVDIPRSMGYGRPEKKDSSASILMRAEARTDSRGNEPSKSAAGSEKDRTKEKIMASRARHLILILATLFAAVAVVGCGPSYPNCETDEHCEETGERCV